jgi:predicted DCC family thiol-disulfide oxidoreductase YuxK
LLFYKVSPSTGANYWFIYKRILVSQHLHTSDLAIHAMVRETIVYDGTCKFCQAQMRKIKKKALPGQFEYVSSYNTKNLKKLGISQKEALNGVFFINKEGEKFHKAAAIQQIYVRLNKHHILSWGRKLPLLRQIIDLGYLLVAKHRYKIYGTCDGECRI